MKNEQTYNCDRGTERLRVSDTAKKGRLIFCFDINKHVIGSVRLKKEDILRLIAQLTAAQGELHVSHSQTISTRGPDVVAVPLAPIAYTLDEFQKAIESLRKDGA